MSPENDAMSPENDAISPEKKTKSPGHNSQVDQQARPENKQKPPWRSALERKLGLHKRRDQDQDTEQGRGSSSLKEDSKPSTLSHEISDQIIQQTRSDKRLPDSRSSLERKMGLNKIRDQSKTQKAKQTSPFESIDQVDKQTRGDNKNHPYLLELERTMKLHKKIAEDLKRDPNTNTNNQVDQQTRDEKHKPALRSTLERKLGLNNTHDQDDGHTEHTRGSLSTNKDSMTSSKKTLSEGSNDQVSLKTSEDKGKPCWRSSLERLLGLDKSRDEEQDTELGRGSYSQRKDSNLSSNEISAHKKKDQLAQNSKGYTLKPDRSLLERKLGLNKNLEQDQSTENGFGSFSINEEPDNDNQVVQQLRGEEQKPDWSSELERKLGINKNLDQGTEQDFGPFSLNENSDASSKQTLTHGTNDPVDQKLRNNKRNPGWRPSLERQLGRDQDQDTDHGLGSFFLNGDSNISSQHTLPHESNAPVDQQMRDDKQKPDSRSSLERKQQLDNSRDQDQDTDRSRAPYSPKQDSNTISKNYLPHESNDPVDQQTVDDKQKPGWRSSLERKLGLDKSQDQDQDTKRSRAPYSPNGDSSTSSKHTVPHKNNDAVDQQMRDHKQKPGWRSSLERKLGLDKSRDQCQYTERDRKADSPYGDSNPSPKKTLSYGSKDPIDQESTGDKNISDWRSSMESKLGLDKLRNQEQDTKRGHGSYLSNRNSNTTPKQTLSHESNNPVDQETSEDKLKPGWRSSLERKQGLDKSRDQDQDSERGCGSFSVNGDTNTSSKQIFSLESNDEVDQHTKNYKQKPRRQSSLERMLGLNKSPDQDTGDNPKSFSLNEDSNTKSKHNSSHESIDQDNQKRDWLSTLERKLGINKKRDQNEDPERGRGSTSLKQDSNPNNLLHESNAQVEQHTRGDKKKPGWSSSLNRKLESNNKTSDQNGGNEQDKGSFSLDEDFNPSMGNTTKVKDWTSENKTLLFFMTATLCLFVSTVALAVSQGDKDCDSHETNTSDPLQRATDVGVSDQMKMIEKYDTTYYRLPRNVVPKHYNLTLIPNLQKKTFNGSVIISINVLEPTKTIILNSKKLSIFVLIIRDSADENVPIASKKGTLDKREFLVINLKEELSKGEYTIILKYSGKLDKGITGLYSSNLKNGR